MTNGVSIRQVSDLNWWAFILLGALAIIFGLLIAVYPKVTTVLLIELIGIFIILLSFGAILRSTVAPGGMKGSILLVLLGIFGFFFGILTILSPTVMGRVIFGLAGLGMFVAGMIGIILAISEKDMSGRGMFALQAVLSLILGVLIMAGPVIGAALLVIIVAAFFVMWGIIGIIMGISIKKAQ
jgi:uncharacterized membrane protein HdeD (DUF308 family)